MKLKLETKYRVGETVWVIDGDVIWKGEVIAICWYGKGDWNYEIDFGGCEEKWYEEHVFKTKKEAQAKLIETINYDAEKAVDILTDFIIKEEYKESNNEL